MNLSKTENSVIAWLAIAITAIIIYGVTHLPGSGQSHSADPQWAIEHAEFEASHACHDRIRTLLKAPATAQFPSVSEEVVLNRGGGRYTIGTWVDAQNSFGALLRAHYSCEAVTANGSSFVTLAVEK